MHLKENCSLTHLNSFALSAIAPKLYELTSLDELSIFESLAGENIYILGEGTNTLFIEELTPIIVRLLIKGITITETEDNFIVTAACGENWHQLVEFCLEQGINGLENLALIPGSVGAAPIQNIGAYGVELSDFLQSVDWYEFGSGTEKRIDKTDCAFGYRDSVFKQALKDKGVITKVTLALPKQWQPVKNYAGLNELPDKVTAKEIFQTVIEIRQQKLPDPKEIPNAGSFFKNPIICSSTFQALQHQYAQVPHYVLPDASIKLPAAWLIEQAGFKGQTVGKAGVHEKQALVLVNRGGATGEDVVSLAQQIITTVHRVFGIRLEQEVRTVGQLGYQVIEVQGG
ncbi:UDP-N-acetylmuramate dehydrogenase [Thalassotalea fusca]